MKLLATIIKSAKENLRNWKILILVLLFSPFFVFLMKLFYGNEVTVYKVGIWDLDKSNVSMELVEEIEQSEGMEDTVLFDVSNIKKKDKMEEMIREKVIDIGLIIPKDYSEKLENLKEGDPAVAQLYGTLSNFRYTYAAIMIAEMVNNQGMETANLSVPATIAETFLEEKAVINEFDSYVPGLISLAVLMILFTASASIVKENDKKTLVRLKMSRLGAFHFLLGESIVQAVIATLALSLAYGMAILLEYQPEGKFLPILIVGIVTSFSMVSISLIVASFLNTIFDVLTVGCFPFFILMFFSGSMFPMPKINLFTVEGHTFGVTDILPLTHTTNAFNQILNSGADIQDVMFEILMIGVLTVFYFAIGLGMYHVRKFSKA